MLAAQPAGDLRCLERQQERAVGKEPARSGEVQVEDSLEPELAANSLVRDRRVDVAVAYDRRATLEGRPDHLVDELRACRRIEQRLGPRGHVAAVEHEVAHLLAELGPARFARRDDLEAVRLEMCAQELRLRRLSRAVETLEGDEHRPPSYGRP